MPSLASEFFDYRLGSISFFFIQIVNSCTYNKRLENQLNDEVVRSSYLCGFFLIVIVVEPVLSSRNASLWEVVQAHCYPHAAPPMGESRRRAGAARLVPRSLLPWQDLQEGIAGHPEATFLPPPRTSSTRSRAQGWSLLLSGPAASDLLLLLPCFESHLALKAPCAPTTKPLTRGIFHPLAKGWVHTRPFPLSTQGGFLERGIPGARERFPEVSSE